METTKNIDALNELIIINNDRLEGYDTASNETEETELKVLFEALKSTSNSNLSELKSEVRRLGGEVEEGTRATGKFFRFWMDFKATLTGNNRGTILDSCEYGEGKALEAYDDALKNGSDLSTEYTTLVQKQRNAIKADHDKVKALRDIAME